jgi:hypothetical protein
MAPLAERFDGSAWSIQRTPDQLEADQLNGVSCTSSRSCIAVGNGQESFAQRWDGKRWSVERLDFGDPQGRANALAGVSCPSQESCAAVGWDDIGLCSDPYESDFDVSVLGFWASGRWSLGRHPNLGCATRGENGGGNGFNAVSCASPIACTAVGSEVARWDGRHWSVQSAPIGTDTLTGVSCTSVDACTAVGFESYTWNGREWSSAPIARPPHVKTVALNSVSCASPESCVAVGSSENAAHQDFLLIEFQSDGAR